MGAVGAKDIANFDQRMSDGDLPDEASITHEGASGVSAEESLSVACA